MNQTLNLVNTLQAECVATSRLDEYNDEAAGDLTTAADDDSYLTGITATCEKCWYLETSFYSDNYGWLCVKCFEWFCPADFLFWEKTLQSYDSYED